jgi:asparaginyl-tRNA synthetase
LTPQSRYLSVAGHYKTYRQTPTQTPPGPFRNTPAQLFHPTTQRRPSASHRGNSSPSQHAMADSVDKIASAAADLAISKGKQSSSPRESHTRARPKAIAVVYIDEDTGIDAAETAGTKELPFKSLLGALIHTSKSIPDAEYQSRKSRTGEPPETREEYKPVAKAALKKAKNAHAAHLKKEAKQAELAAKEAEQKAAREAQLEAAKAITLVEDASKPVAKKIKIRDTTDHRNVRVAISGWIHRLRHQKNMIFITLRDGTGLLQCILADKLTETYDALTLTLETTITLHGEIKEVPAGAHAPGGHELIVDYYTVVGKAPGGDEAITNIVAPDADAQTKYNYRHLTIRGDVASATLKVRAAVVKAFRRSYDELGLLEVTPPCMVQTQCEGGATLFEFDYYGEKVRNAPVSIRGLQIRRS